MKQLIGAILLEQLASKFLHCFESIFSNCFYLFCSILIEAFIDAVHRESQFYGKVFTGIIFGVYFLQ